MTPYSQLWKAGINTFHHHRPLEEYLDAFLVTGLQLTNLEDLSRHVSIHEPGTILPEGYRFPRFILPRFI